MADEIKAKNITNPAVKVTIENLDVPDAEIQAGATVDLTDTNNSIEIQNDPQLKALVSDDDVILLLEGHELTKSESILLLEEVLPEMASTSLSGGSVDTGHCFAGKREKYCYFEGPAFSASSVSVTGADWIVSVTGAVKRSGGTVEPIGFDDGTNSAQVYLDSATNTIKSRVSGDFSNQEYKLKVIYITT